MEPSSEHPISGRPFVFWGVGLLLVGGFYLAGVLAHLWILVLASILLALFLDGLARPLTTRIHLRRTLAVLLVTVVLAGLTALLLWLLGPRIADQIEELQRRLPRALDRIRSWVKERAWLSQWLQPGAGVDWRGAFDLSHRVTAFLSTLLGALTAGLLVFFAGLYLALSPEKYLNGVVRLAPPAHRERARDMFVTVGTGLRRWLVGRATAMAAVAVLTSLGLWGLGVSLALTLGLLAGALTFIPFVGPILSAVPAILLALMQSVQLAFWVALLYVVVQIIENNVITPAVQQRAVSLPPALLLWAQIAAAILFGPIGVVFATPMTVALTIAVQILYLREGLGDEIPLLTEEST